MTAEVDIGRGAFFQRFIVAVVVEMEARKRGSEESETSEES